MVVGVNAVHVAVESPVPATRPDLGVLGRVLLAAVFAIGLFVGYSSGLGLFLYSPFAGVGAYLVVRRPRMSIGWMLFGIVSPGGDACQRAVSTLINDLWGGRELTVESAEAVLKSVGLGSIRALPGPGWAPTLVVGQK